jgi:hypothetical protein
MPSPPPTFPQQHQASVYQSEHDAHLMANPEQHGTPTGPSTSTGQPPSHTSGPSTSAVQPPSHTSATFDGHTYTHLPAHLAAMMSAIPALPVPQQCCGRSPVVPMHAPSSVTFFLFYFHIKLNSFFLF